MSWRLILGLILLLAALLSGWSAWRQRVQPSPPSAGADRSDYVMHDFEIVSLNKQGQEALTLRAPEMHRNPTDQSLSVTTPLFLLPDSSGKHWQIQSQQAWLSPDHSELHLLTDVQGHSPADAPPPTTFRTERLDIFPDQNLARTELPVTLTQPGSILTGVGFQTHLKNKTYEFNSQVKSVYAPKSAR